MSKPIDHDSLVSTLGELARHGHDLDCYCRICERQGKDAHRLVLTDRMAEKLGPDFTVAEFSRRYRCHLCGSVGESVMRISVRSARASYPR